VGIIQAIVYGLIQGLTEFLPVSSTAHIRIVPSLLGWEDPGAAFTAIIQLGTVLAVLIYFAKDIGKALSAWINSITGKKDFDKNEARLAWAVFVGTLPIVVIGLAFQHKIETSLRSLYVIAVSLILMGIVMLVAEKMGRRKRSLPDVDVKDGGIVGLWQCLALIPGVSRSGSTISGALFQGFDRVTAARFSFLLSIPSVLGAGLYEAYKAIKETKADGVAHVEWGPTIVATIVSFIVGYAAIAFFIQYLQRRGMAPFVWYRIALGLLIVFLVSQGHIKPDAGAKDSPKTNPELKTSIAPPNAGWAVLVGSRISPTPNPLPQRQTTLRDGAPEAYVLEKA
jgi:undecaprenyl-diphosphatase